ncbi:hypothetical protein Tco_0648680 [Tanacetum coccineum]
MSTSKTYQQSLANAGSENRPPMLKRGSYIPWVSRFRRYLNRKRDNQEWLLKALDEGPYEFKNFVPEGLTTPRLQTAKDLEGDDLLLHDVEMEVMNMILLSITNEIYNSVDACTSAKDMWKRVERLMRGTIQNKVDRETLECCHYGYRNCPKPRVRDCEVIIIRTNVAGQNKDEAGVILTVTEMIFLFADASRMEEIE